MISTSLLLQPVALKPIMLYLVKKKMTADGK
jgi:hypothetical protein